MPSPGGTAVPALEALTIHGEREAEDCEARQQFGTRWTWWLLGDGFQVEKGACAVPVL